MKMQNAVHNNINFTRLNPLDCLEEYSTPFGDRSDIVLVALGTSDTDSANNSVLACGTQGAVDKAVHKGTHPGEWMCRQSNMFSCKTTLGFGGKPAKMVLRSDRVSGIVCGTVIYTEQAPQKRPGLLGVRCLPALRYPHAPNRRSPDRIEVAISSRFRHC